MYSSLWVFFVHRIKLCQITVELAGFPSGCRLYSIPREQFLFVCLFVCYSLLDPYSSYGEMYKCKKLSQVMQKYLLPIFILFQLTLWLKTGQDQHQWNGEIYTDFCSDMYCWVIWQKEWMYNYKEEVKSGEK